MHQAQTLTRETRIRRRALARRRAFQRGQSIVVALLVLLLLGLAGALFVTIVARNLLNARHASRVVTADQYARAGITFAAAQLSNSLDGADWRPPLQTRLLNPPTEARELARYTAAVTANSLPAADPKDPDKNYLEAGFARYNTGVGRFLLRLTYTPVLLRDSVTSSFYDPVIKTDASGTEIPVVVPPGKYIKIESIGREGVIDLQDPTTYANNRSSDRLQAYQVAYQPIGITDYARFETNLANRSTTADIGVASRFYADDADGGIATPAAYDFVTDPNNPNTPVLKTTPLDPMPQVPHPVYQLYPVFTTYGAADAYKVVSGSGLVVPNPTAGTLSAIDTTGTKYLPGGGSFHANMPVRFFGKNLFYLNNAGINAPLYQDGLEVAGDLLLNGYDQTLPLFTTSTTAQKGQRASVEINPVDLTKLTAAPAPVAPATPTMNLFVVPSNDTGGPNGGFSTFGGLVRDGSPQNDSTGQPRSIGRLEPPRMDAVESASQLPRYKAIATTSPPRLDPTTGLAYAQASGALSPSQYGYGQSIYINNPNDIQQNSTTIGGGSTLIDQWLNNTAENVDKHDGKGGWDGQFYNPPGVNITLGRFPTGKNKPMPLYAYGIRMTLSQGKFPKPDGTDGTLGSQTVLYDDINASNDPATEKTKTLVPNPDNDVLLYAEGNVRVHGVASLDPADTDAFPANPDDDPTDKFPRHITIVTNGTAYIDGSLLKGNPDSTITVLAHDYVCVNTTQFLAGPQSDTNPLGTPPPTADGDHLTFGSDERWLSQEFNFGLPNGGTPATAYYGSPLGLYISAVPGATGSTQADLDIVNPVTGYSIRGINVLPFQKDALSAQSVWSPTFDPASLLPGSPDQLNPALQYFDLTKAALTDNSISPATALTSLVQSDTRLLVTRRDPNPTDPAATQDLLLNRVAILPMDIRIEAVLYAQTGSFFVIPGSWFNNDSSDSLDQFVPTVTTTNKTGTRITSAETHFPFYGQPIDMKIIISGAVSEAQPVDVADQTAWMLKWGWIPQYHGYASQVTPAAGAPMTGPPLESAGHLLTDASSTPKPGGKPAIGLQIIYNPQAGYPYHPADPAKPMDTSYYLRSDAYGRPLPFSPKLPVSAALLFAGESSEPPLLQ